MFKVIRAFFKTVQMMFKGELIQPPQTRYPNLQAWVDRGLILTEQAYQAANAQGMTEDVRRQLTFTLNSRPISMETILAAVKHNLTLEYPMLMKAQIEHNLTTLYAMNLDDQYRVAQLANRDELAPPVQSAVQTLADHLQNIPSSQNP